MNTCQRGLTLIEVLVALAIIAIAMTAAIKATSADIQGVAHLQEKTMALWVGEQAINEARVRIIELPEHEPLRQVTQLLNREWYWVLSQHETPNPRIRQIIVKVFARKENEDNDEYIVKLTSYVYTILQDESKKNDNQAK